MKNDGLLRPMIQVPTKICLCGQEAPFGNELLFSGGDIFLSGMEELCEDLWCASSSQFSLVLKRRRMCLHPVSRPGSGLIGKHDYLESLIKQQSSPVLSVCICVCICRAWRIIDRCCIQWKRYHCRKWRVICREHAILYG